MNVECGDCGTNFLVDASHVVHGLGCPNCGGTRMFRSQPSPTKSDGELRDMVDPSTGVDQGGNPLQEGILGDWQPRSRRDESFASVHTADAVPQHVFRMNAGMLHGGPTSILPLIFDAHINGGSLRDKEYRKGIIANYGNPHAPHYGEEIDVAVHDPSHEPAVRQIIENGASVGSIRGLSQSAPLALEAAKAMNAGTMPVPPGVPADQFKFGNVKVAMDFDLDFGADDDDGEPSHKFVVSPSGSIHSLPNPGYPNPVHHEDIARLHGLQNYPQGYSLGHLFDDGTTEWLQHEAPFQPQQMAEIVGNHFQRPVTIDPNLQPASSDTRWFGDQGPRPDPLERLTPNYKELILKQRQLEQQRGRPFGYYENPFFNRGGSVLGEVSNQDIYMPWQHEHTAAFLAPLAEGATALLGGEGASTLAAPLMRGAMFGAGSNAIKGLIPGGGGGGNGGGGQQDAAEAQAPAQDINQLGSRQADYETPGSNPSVGTDHDDPDRVDQHEFNDGDNSPNPHNPENPGDAGTPTQGEDGHHQDQIFQPNSPAIEKLQLLAPLALHYYHSDESGANDPILRSLHEALEAESPGYLNHADKYQPLLDQALQHIRHDSPGVTAAGVNPGGIPQAFPVQPATGPQGPLQTPQEGQHPGGGQGTCPNCGGVLTADGSCPQCGAKATPFGANPHPGPGGGPPGSGAGPLSMPPNAIQTAKTAGDPNHQGPITDAQKSAVADLLVQTGRADEVGAMIEQPENYAKELAEVAHRLNTPPNVDDPTPPAPAQEEAPPGATMPMPNPADPTQQISSIVAKLTGKTSADSIAARCPECGSGTTGIVNNEGDSRCHSCGSIFKTKGVITDDQPFTSKTAEYPYEEDLGTPSCPGCGGPGMSLGVLGSREHFRCRNCGMDFSGKHSDPVLDWSHSQDPAHGGFADLERTPESYYGKTADRYDHNVDAVPEPERHRQRDIEQEQDSSQTWADDSGAPLVVGQEYEMHSPKFSIPDIVRVDQVKPDSVVLTIIGEYSNDPQQSDIEYTHEITAQEAQMDGLTFTPSGDNGPAATDDSGTPNTKPIAQQPLQNSDQHQHITHNLEEAEKLAAQETLPEDHCPKCSSQHISSAMSSPETVMHECYRCGKVWETRDADLGPIDDDATSRDWLHESSGLDYEPSDNFGIPTDHTISRNLHDIAARTKQAGKKFTPREQRDLIDEDGVARNADLLNLTGTHYEDEQYVTRDDWSGKAKPYNVPDEHLVLGLP